MRELVVCGLTNVAHLHRNSKQGGTLSVQALKRGNEEREDSYAAAAAAGVAVTGKGIVALPDTAASPQKPARMYVHARIHDGHVGKGD